MNGNKLMVAGPTEIEKDILLAGAHPMVYNRTPEFSKFINRVEENLKRLFMTKDDIFILCSSGTGAMEAAVVNLLSENDEILIVISGTFSHRWYEITNRFNVKAQPIEIPEGGSINPHLINEKINSKTKAVFVTANETSLGTTTDVEAIGKCIKDTKTILVVDAISSLGSDRFETDNWFCDVVISSSQKALALPPGLAFITISKKAWYLQEKSNLPKYYFDLKNYKENLVRGQTPFTPPISLLYQLDLRLKKILEKGMDLVVEEHREKSLYLQKGLESMGLKVIGNRPSNGVIGVLFPERIDAFEVVQRLRVEFNIEITPSPGNNKARIARIGLFGNLNNSDIDDLLTGLRKIIQT